MDLFDLVVGAADGLCDSLSSGARVGGCLNVATAAVMLGTRDVAASRGGTAGLRLHEVNL